MHSLIPLSLIKVLRNPSSRTKRLYFVSVLHVARSLSFAKFKTNLAKVGCAPVPLVFVLVLLYSFREKDMTILFIVSDDVILLDNYEIPEEEQLCPI